MGTNTGIGIGIGIPFKNNALGGDRPYLPPELKARLIGVWDNYGKKNTDADRNIIKNKIPNAGGDLEILNAAYKLNSGFGEYNEDFTTWSKVAGTSIITDSKYVLTDEKAITNGGYFLWNRLAKDSFKVKISNIPNGGWMSYRYKITEEDTQLSSLFIREDGIYTLPATVAGSDVDFFISTVSAPAKDWVGLTIEQIPSFEGAFVTDGINDMITSAKTVQEMLGGSNEITVVSMMANLDSRQILCNSNFSNTLGYNVRNTLEPNGVITMLGYTDKNGTTNNLNLIMGDKDSIKLVDKVNFNSDYVFYPAQYYKSYYQVAWYWTFIANRVLTEDEINQVIAYFNLDRTLKPDIYCNIERQGITNENHNDFNNQLIDYSGNGRNIQMNNLGWVGGSGIAAKQGESIRDYSIIPDEATQTLTIYNEFKYKIKSKQIGTYWTVQYINKTNTSYPITIVADKNSFWVNSCTYYDVDNNKQVIRKEIEVSANTPTSVLCCGYDQFDIPEDATSIVSAVSYINYKAVGEITVEFIPSHKGAVILDGVNDFGKAVGLPIYKDYTFAIEREILSSPVGVQYCVASKSSRLSNRDGAYIVELLSATEGGTITAYSFYNPNALGIVDKSKIISYQTKYKYLGNDIVAGTALDDSYLWIGTVRDNDNRFGNVAIYSLISFPYSMNKFLLDRQLKKHKAGTLYKDMVQFRPVIKQDDRIKSISYFVNLIGATVGEYYSVGSPLGISIETVAPYKVTSLKVNGKNTVPNADYKGFNTTLTGKSPQKITTTIEVDETLVRFNPTINSNVPYTILNYYTVKNSVWTPIKVGDYLPVAERVAIQLKFNDDKGDVYEVIDYTCPNMDAIVKQKNSSVLGWTLWGNLLKGQHTQNITIEVDEYIKYEDIVQPYPVLLRFNDASNNQITWGDKIKVGSTITRIGSIIDADNNLLKGLYTVAGLSLNGKAVTTSNSVVEKQMVFKTTATYIKDNNEPTAWLSPRLLRMPNSSYKYLGYIPDITGHGNHGYIKNSAYAKSSGANYYTEKTFNNWQLGKNISKSEILKDSILRITNVISKNIAIIYNLKEYYTTSHTQKYKITGVDENHPIIFGNDITTNKVLTVTQNGEYEVDWKTFGENPCIIANWTGNCNITIEQIGVHEGSFALDGVNDSIDFSSDIVAGKQVLLNMITFKPNGEGVIFDSRGTTNNGFAIFGNSSDDNGNIVPVYNNKNVEHTYIDGIENKYIIYNNIRNITHVAVCTRDYASTYPVIGCNKSKQFYSKLAIWDCILFPEISTPAMITSHSKYVGIKAKIDIPNWYYDVHGKTNFDTYKTQITEQIGYQKNGTSGNYVANNYNFEYNKMSGYGGYSFSPFSNTDDWAISQPSTPSTVEIISIDGYSYTAKRTEGSTYWKYRNVTTKELNNDLPFKFRCTKNIRLNWEFKYRTAEQPDFDSTLALMSTLYEADTIHTVTLRHKTQEERDALGVTSYYYLIYFAPIEIPVGEEYTVEMLPLYPNSLVYDGITDYTEQARIPTMTDFTLLIKALRLTDFIGSGGAVIKKGDSKNIMRGGYDFVYCLDSSALEANRNSYWSFGKACLNPTAMPLIGYMTKTNVNGVETTFGTNPSKEGITIGFWAGGTAMVFYKTIIYDKTVEQFWIDFLRNMMAREEIIDITYPIFVQGTGGG